MIILGPWQDLAKLYQRFSWTILVHLIFCHSQPDNYEAFLLRRRVQSSILQGRIQALEFFVFYLRLDSTISAAF